MNSTLAILWRHFTSGRLNILLAALVISTASLSAITMVAGAVQNTILKQASHSLAADAKVRGSKPLPEQWLELSKQGSLETAQSIQFRAMAFSEQVNILTSVKAVSDAYPLLGELTVANIPYGNTNTVSSGPSPGEAWLSPRLFAGLGIEPGDSIDIGEQSFTATRTLVREPDSLQSAFNAAPRIMIHIDDVDATGAIQLGSRVNYALMLTGSDADLQGFKAKIDLGADFRWHTIEDSNQRLGNTLDKATQFIKLAGILSIILAAIGIALATRSYVAEQIPQVALLKTLGVTPRRIMRLYLMHIAIIASLGTTTGIIFGILIYQLIKTSIATLLTNLAAPDFTVLAFTATLSMSVFFLFAVPYFFHLRGVSPSLVLQQGSSASLLNNWRSLVLSSVAAFILCGVFSGNLALTAYVFVGLLICCFLAMLCGLAVIYLAALTTRRAGPILRLGVANLVRHKVHTVPQIMMFSILFMLVFTLILIRTALLDTWQSQLPENAPNHYVYNIFDGEKADVLETLAQHDIQQQPFYPIFGGRLTQVNGLPTVDVIEQAENQVNYEREFGLTWNQQLGDDNRIVRGQWWKSQPSQELGVSVEEEFAKGLKLKIGDTLTFSINGSPTNAKVSSIRKVQWDSMNLNFYHIFNKPPSSVLNANWATSFYLDAGQKNVINNLARSHPTLSIIELDQAIAQIKSIVSRVTLSIELVTLLILGSGCVILIASIQSTYRTRLQEGAILRTFGASKRLVQRLNLVEFGAIGLASGVLATLGAEVVLWLIGKRILNTDPVLHWPIWLVGPTAVTLIIVTITSAFTKQLHRQPPMSVLKSI